LTECEALGGCPTGSAKITRGYHLPAKHVIHIVGPVWHGGQRREAELLRSCYETSLQLAEENHLHSIAFPCISTGVYRFPPEQACAIAVDAVAQWLREHEWPEEVVFCCFVERDVKLYESRLNSDRGPSDR
jgi:O-acetyl-ADP-ribose deacetylase (regulator of RNase III)